MINIAKRKLPSWAVSIILYISYCAMSWYVMRGSLAYYGQKNGGLAAWFANDIWAFFLGGILPFALFELFSSFIFRALSVKAGGDIASIKYGISLTVAAANVLLFAVKFIYIAVPLCAPIINIIIDPVVTVGMAALYMWYAFYQNYVDKTHYGFVLTQVMTTFLMLYGLLALLNLILAVSI